MMSSYNDDKAEEKFSNDKDDTETRNEGLIFSVYI